MSDHAPQLVHDDAIVVTMATGVGAALMGLIAVRKQDWGTAVVGLVIAAFTA